VTHTQNEVPTIQSYNQVFENKMFGVELRICQRDENNAFKTVNKVMIPRITKSQGGENVQKAHLKMSEYESGD